MSKCNYCAFYSFACSNPDWQKYADDICSELKFWADKLGRIEIPTIFFGGGTPSLMLIDAFEQIIKCIKDNFNISPNCEITLESNPGTIDKNKLADFVSNGVNRLSVGVQSLKEEELIFLGRRHNVKQSLDLLNAATQMNLRLSADFIYGFPNHNVESVVELCGQINKLGLEHVSMYELTIEENTPFGKMNLKMPDNDTMAKMYEAIGENLFLPRYEVSNYAKPNEHCIHNENVWAGKAYIGIGRGGAGRVYFDNIWYEQKGNNELFEKMNDDTRTTEKILTGMRTIRGVELTDDVKKMLNFDWIKTHKDLVEIDKKYLHTTPQGLLILDDLILDLIK
ncbi:MAG: radical SAM family heme chaperone HemW [Alphaproteobacteria bacterium]|nr:radical SAM family heme chaperone HemW [Alphaproteobacteria bacterium]